jgi:hypothetical protein
MIDREHKLSVARQARLLGFSRGSIYYLPRPVSEGDLALMRRRTNASHSLGDRRTASRLPLCRKSDVAMAFEGRRAANGAASRRDADEEDGHRGDLSSP